MGGAWNDGRSERAWGGARQRERTPSQAVTSFCQLLWQAVGQSCQLLLPLPYEVVKVSLADEEGRFGANEAAEVLQLRFCEVSGEDAMDQALPSFQVLFQLLSIVSLTKDHQALVKEGVLKRDKSLFLTPLLL